MTSLTIPEPISRPTEVFLAPKPKRAMYLQKRSKRHDGTGASYGKT
jgi:hypothetical protein